MAVLLVDESKLFPSLSLVNGRWMIYFPKQDFKFWKTLPPSPLETLEKIRKQGVHESLYSDIMTGYGKWEFDPFDKVIRGQSPDNDGVAHI